LSGGGNRPGGNWNRPEGGWNRPGIGGNRPNRPGIGDGNNFWNSGNWNGNNFNNINVNGGWGGGYYGGGWNGGAWGYPGWGGGYGGWNNGYVNPHYGGWYNGSWSGNWGGYNGGWWAPFAVGAATWGLASAVSNWGLGYGALGYGGGAYVNPYYSSIPAAVVAASPYDYSQPVVVNNYIPVEGDATTAVPQQGGGQPAAAPSDDANAAVDAALEKFKAGNYAGALDGFDAALKLSPKDSVIHEVRALTLFALGRYPEAAATLNSVLASAPGMDWTTISNLYSSVDAYTAQLRKLEDFCRSNPGDAAAHFVLAYHYLIGGHADSAAAALRVVVAKQPGDMVAKRLLEAVAPPAAAEPKAEAVQPSAATPAAESVGPETDLVGAWKATSGKETIALSITEDSKFSWKATPEGKPPVELSGTVDTAADAIALNSEQAGTMVGKVASKGADAFEFSLPGAPKDAKPLLFQRQK
jgi:tetratricopeptide (TPR) repeat protein